VSKALHQPPLNTSQMGMVIAAANYFDLPVTTKQAFFESGHGFMVNTGKDMCPSGPYVWDARRFRSQLSNFGLHAQTLGTVFPGEADDNRLNLQSQIRHAMQAGKVIGLGHWDYQVVLDANDQGFQLSQPWDSETPTTPGFLTADSWKELANAPPIEVIAFTKCEPLDDVIRTDAALQYALDVFNSPEDFQHPGYGLGLNAYPIWRDSLSHETYDMHGQWWNATVWSECRLMTGQYMQDFSSANSAFTKGLNALGDLYVKLAETICESAPQDVPNRKKLELISQAEELENQCVNHLRTLPWN